MSHYAILAPAYTGHLNPLGVLGRALARRGHRVTMLSTPNAADRIRAAGLEFAPIAAEEFPGDEWNRMMARAGAVTGLKATAAAARMIARLARGIVRDVPDVARRRQLDGLVMDQICVGAESVCEVIGLRLAVACSALAMHIESRVPPPNFPWRYRTGLPFRVRNTLATFGVNMTGLPVLRVLGPYRFRHRLPAMGFHYVNELRPSLVQVAQQPAFLDFPRRGLPVHLHYTGPWLDDHASGDIPFPWQRLDGRRLVFASMGTIQDQMATAARVIVEACDGLDVQLVFTLGRQGAVADFPTRNNAILVDYAPQRALLQRAALTVCHAGLNTTLESLAAGVPMVALPISNDQPGNAVRLEHLGLGVCIPFRELTAERLRRAVADVLARDEFKARAQRAAAAIAQAQGPAVAAELIERALSTGERVRRTAHETAICKP